MTSVRVRTCVTGAALAVAAGALVDHGAQLGADLPATALLGLAAGAVLALLPTAGGAAGRAGGFLAGFAATWLAYGLRAGVLPDIPMGRAIAAVLVVSVVTAVATATAERLPLWSGLLGAVALVGVYETTYTATPSAFMAESAVAATSVLLSAAIGFAVATFAAVLAPTSPDGADAVARSTAETTRDRTGEFVDAATLLPIPRVSPDAAAEDESAR